MVFEEKANLKKDLIKSLMNHDNENRHLCENCVFSKIDNFSNVRCLLFGDYLTNNSLSCRYYSDGVTYESFVRYILLFCHLRRVDALEAVKENAPENHDIISSDILRRYLSSSGHAAAFYDVIGFILDIEKEKTKFK